MKAVVYDHTDQLPTVREVPDPVCPPDGVVVAVRATGVCRSDWHAWRGHDPVALPHIPGHEFAGVVDEVGAGVTRWSVGDRVTAPFVCGCGRCEYCARGEQQVCPHQTQPGFTGPGSFAERVAIDAADVNLVALPDALDFATAASLGCRFATAFRALSVHGRVGPGDWLVVHGCGGVGLSAVMIGAALGARVVAIDVSAAALALASDLGAAAVIDASRDDDVAASVVALTDGGAHVSIDALGRPETAVASVRCLRRRGRHVQVGLLLGADATSPLPMDRVIARELELHGSHGMAAHEYPAMLALIEDGTLAPHRLIGARLGLDDAGAALAAMGGPAAAPGITIIALPG
ncbi:zinc-dependent alcohol dehydrogenase family protein [Propioniciclava coleopterorum]|uniref:Zinc-dependent alcohol dehydrogenase family protein n=1 Tax=Propioniciclava coleopterorum TaxID=2714937 RepID=A0A6G7Y4N3_9ACTN|nr:zinc-dependent alcohol dehydrogenase family protein [Propioniciclava coleopterorum]QIK71780.1 zinc-dependent alcohol dehydrogenase family protein [Propioniciclava coleopterorum]